MAHFRNYEVKLKLGNVNLCNVNVFRVSFFKAVHHEELGLGSV